MKTETGASSLNGASSAVASGVSPAFPVIPEKLAEHTGALQHAMIELMAPPVAEPKVAAAEFGHRLENVALSLDQIYQDANTSFQSVNHVAEEAFRRHFELGMHFFEELAVARGPVEALKLQFNFFSAQFNLLTEQAKEMQQQFAGLFLAAQAQAIRKPEAETKPAIGDNKV